MTGARNRGITVDRRTDLRRDVVPEHGLGPPARGVGSPEIATCASPATTERTL